MKRFGCAWLALALARPQWMIRPARMLAVLMILNGSGHLGGSLYFGVLLPGSYSSPFLIAAGIFLLCESRYN